MQKITFRIIIIIIIIYSKVKTAKLKILIVTLLQSYNVTKNNKTSLSELKAVEIKEENCPSNRLPTKGNG